MHQINFLNLKKKILGRPSGRLIKIAKASDKVTNALYELEKLINGEESEPEY